MKVAIAGAGWSGAVLADQLAKKGHAVTVFESRPHIGGNSHTERDPETGVMLHVYGPHIFHTDNEEVWNYVRRYDEFVPYIHRVKAVVREKVYSLPINLLTINQFFGTAFSPEQARAFINSQSDSSIDEPRNFEEQALKFIGRDLYEAFFRGYTAKQWGIHPSALPAAILKRLPVRFTYDDNYFNHLYQGIPKNGYSHIMSQLLSRPGVSVELGVTFTRGTRARAFYDHVFYSGPVDAWFDHKFERLPYRTLDFEVERRTGDAQGCAVLNSCDFGVPHTRVTEFKHFTPWETHDRTITYREFSREWQPGDEPYYPIHLAGGQEHIEKYKALSRAESGVTFVGRLGTYRYLDMDVTIAEALAVAQKFSC